MAADPVVRMANDIAAHFRHLPPGEAQAAVAGHLRAFWEPRMRASLIAHAATAPPDLDPLVVAAVTQLPPTGVTPRPS
jgi:formate dehydrogenase subunit delta